MKTIQKTTQTTRYFIFRLAENTEGQIDLELGNRAVNFRVKHLREPEKLLKRLTTPTKHALFGPDQNTQLFDFTDDRGLAWILEIQILQDHVFVQLFQVKMPMEKLVLKHSEITRNKSFFDELARLLADPGLSKNTDLVPLPHRTVDGPVPDHLRTTFGKTRFKSASRALHQRKPLVPAFSLSKALIPHS